jgi:hypothetical protein
LIKQLPELGLQVTHSVNGRRFAAALIPEVCRFDDPYFMARNGQTAADEQILNSAKLPANFENWSGLDCSVRREVRRQMLSRFVFS